MAECSGDRHDASMRNPLTLVTARRPRALADLDPDGVLGAEAAAVLRAAGITIGEPMGADRPGRPAPRRGLDDLGRDLVVHIVRTGEGPAGARMVRRLAALRGLRHPALARVLEVVALPQGRAAVAVELVAGASLAVVLGARSGLGRAECARLLDDVGGALAHLHAAGLAHGDVAPGNVMITLEGGAVLIDLLPTVMERGTAGTAAPERAAGGPATPASDVYALAALLRLAAQPGCVLEERLGRVTRDPLATDPAQRPTARALAARAHEIAVPGRISLPDGARLAAGALRAAAAQPTRLVGSRRDSRPARPASEGRRRSSAPSFVTGAVVGALAAGAVAVGALGVRPWDGGLAAVASAVGGGAGASTGSPAAALTSGEKGASGRTAAPSATSTSTASAPTPGSGDAPSREDLRAVVLHLYAVRDNAIEAGDAETLATTTAPGSAARAEDDALLAQLVESGETVQGLSTDVLGVVEFDVPAQVDAPEGARAAVVRTSQAASTRVGADGSARTVPAQPARDALLVLVPGPWRVLDVLPAPDASGS